MTEMLGTHVILHQNPLDNIPRIALTSQFEFEGESISTYWDCSNPDGTPRDVRRVDGTYEDLGSIEDFFRRLAPWRDAVLRVAGVKGIADPLLLAVTTNTLSKVSAKPTHAQALKLWQFAVEANARLAKRRDERTLGYLSLVNSEEKSDS